MPLFTFETDIADEPATIAVESLPDQKAAWCYVEFLATQLKLESGARIRVKNAEGEVIIDAGARTAIASIDWCRNLACPLKKPAGEK